MHFTTCSLLVLLPATVLAQAHCPEVPYTECMENEHVCWGGYDATGCSMPDTCMQMHGPMGNDGMECWNHCPAVCNPEYEMTCHGGWDYNGCQMPEFCHWKSFDNNGNVCPTNCPVTCGPEETWCYGGGMDSNGCPLPDSCIPSQGPTGKDT